MQRVHRKLLPCEVKLHSKAKDLRLVNQLSIKLRLVQFPGILHLPIKVVSQSWLQDLRYTRT